MKNSRLPLWSGLRLAVRRSLSAGGGMQFIMPVCLFVLVWLVCGGLFAVLVHTGAVPDSLFSSLRTDLADKGPFGQAFYHLFTAGGVDEIKGGPGWLVSLIGLVLIALLTSIFTNYFFEVAEDYKEGRSNFKLYDHVAVFGFTDSVPALLKNMLEGEYSGCYFLVLTAGRVPAARAKMANMLTQRQMRRVVILQGEIDSALGVRRMQVDRAQEIIVPGDRRGDGQVLDCVKLAAGMMPSGKRIPCYVQFASRTASSVFQFADIDSSVGGKLMFVPFNRFELWALKLLVNKSVHLSPDGPLPLEGATGICADSPAHVHLVIAGMTTAGTALALTALRVAHYPNVVGNPGCRTRISFVQSGIEAGMQKLMAEFPSMFALARWRYCKDSMPEWRLPSGTEHLGGDFLDFEIEFIDSEITGGMVRDYLAGLAEDDRIRLTVAMCQESPEDALEQAVTLPSKVLGRAIQVLVYQPQSGTVANALASGSTVCLKPLRTLRPFGMAATDFDLSLLKELIRDAAGLHIDTSGGGMASKSSASQMWSDVYSACHIWTKARSAGPDFALSRDVLARTEHNRWNTEQLLMNFRPLTKEEQQSVLDLGAQRKSALKRGSRAHLDICSWECLCRIDPDVVRYDYDMVDKSRAVMAPGQD